MARRLKRRRVRWGMVALALAGAVYLGSLRYALVVTPIATMSLGVMNGAATVHIHDDGTGKAQSRPLGTDGQKRVSFYRHGYRTVWWVEGWRDFAAWARGKRRPAVVPVPPTPSSRSGAASSMIPLMMSVSPNTTLCRLEVPLWMPIGAFAAPYLLVCARRWRRRAWQCRGCGYDLRGGAVTGRACPECGRAFEREGGGDAVAGEA